MEDSKASHSLSFVSVELDHAWDTIHDAITKKVVPLISVSEYPKEEIDEFWETAKSVTYNLADVNLSLLKLTQIIKNFEKSENTSHKTGF